MSGAAPRWGIGFDSHRLEEGRRLVLGGVEVPEAERGLAGWSDADVLTHAVIDALLGAAALGDIGVYFPDTDERWRDADLDPGAVSVKFTTGEGLGFVGRGDGVAALAVASVEPR